MTMANSGKRRVAGSYIVSMLSIALVLVVVGVLAFIFLNARQISDHVKQNIGFSIIVKDNVNEAEIKKFQRKVNEKGLTIVPLEIYLKGNLVKMKIALARGKNVRDKKEAIKEKDMKIDARRQLKEMNY